MENRFLVTISLVIWATLFSFAQPVIPPPVQTDEIIIDLGSAGSADPADRIRYQVTIQNTGTSNASGTQLNIVPDPRTTFVAGSFRSSPLALPDVYDVTGNVGLNVPVGSGLKANDFDDNIAGATITAGTFATTQNGSIMINADGSFMYTPPAGFTGTDTYTYTLNDGNGVGGSVPATDMGAITFNVANLIWFIDNSSMAATSDGRLTSPFKSLADFNAGSATAAAVVYLEHTGTDYTSGIILQNNERLFGEGHTGAANLSGVLPFTLATHSKTLPNINGTRPVITNASGDGITLAQHNTLRGLDVGACSDFAIENSGTTTIGNLVISELSINNTTGGGFDASHGSGASTSVVINSLSSAGGVHGINLTNCAGSFTVNGGTITNPTGTGVLISGGSVVFSSSGNISDNTGFVIDVDNHDSTNPVTFSGNITSTATGIRVQNCGAGTKTFSGSSKNLSTTTTAGVTLSSNAGATITFTNGGLVINTTTGIGFTATAGGTVSVTGTGNTINSVSATALNVVNTTIGAMGLTFQSISSGNNTAAADPMNGIILTSTGTNGGLTVTGTGSAGSGGTIQFTSNDGMSFTSVGNISLSYMIIQDIGDMAGGIDVISGDDGIHAANISSLTLTHTTIRRISDNAIHGATASGASTTFSGLVINNCLLEYSNRFHVAGTGDANNESMVRILGISGTVTLSNSTFQHGAEFIDFFPMTGTLNMTVTNNDFLHAYKEFTSGSLASIGLHGIDVTVEGTAAVNITIGDEDNPALGNSFLNCRVGSVRLLNNPGATGNMTFIISHNSFVSNDHSSGIGGDFDFPMGGLLLGSLGTNTPVIEAIVSNNYFDEITNASGGVGQFSLAMDGGQWEVLVENNTFDTPGNAPFFVRADNNMNVGTMNSSVLFQNNTYIRGGFCSPDPAAAGPGCGGCGDAGMGAGFCGPGIRSLVQVQNGGNINITFINEDFAQHDVGYDPGNTVEIHAVNNGGSACVNFNSNSSPHGYSTEQSGAGVLNVYRGLGVACTNCTAVQLETLFAANGNTGGMGNPSLSPPDVNVFGIINTTNTQCATPGGGIFAMTLPTDERDFSTHQLVRLDLQNINVPDHAK